MSAQTILLCVVVPFLVLVLVFGVVVVVALCHARPEDIPTVLKESTDVFRRMVDRAPRINAHPRHTPHEIGPVPHTDQTTTVEEVA